MNNNNIKETKRPISREEMNDWFNLVFAWLSFIITSILILYLSSVWNSIFSLWNLFPYIFLFFIGILIAFWISGLFETIFRNIWVNYYTYNNDKEYYEKDIESSLFKRIFFFFISLIVFVVSVLVNICFIRPYREVKDIENICWINYQQAQKIKNLPTEEKEMVVKYCGIKKDKQWINTIINNFLLNNKVCNFNQEKIDEIKNLSEKKDEESIKIIKNIISNEINICKENIIKNKVETMDNKFNWDFWDDFNNLVDFQKRINEI